MAGWLDVARIFYSIKETLYRNRTTSIHCLSRSTLSRGLWLGYTPTCNKEIRDSWLASIAQYPPLGWSLRMQSIRLINRLSFTISDGKDDRRTLPGDGNLHFLIQRQALAANVCVCVPGGWMNAVIIQIWMSNEGETVRLWMKDLEMVNCLRRIYSVAPSQSELPDCGWALSGVSLFSSSRLTVRRMHCVWDCSPSTRYTTKPSNSRRNIENDILKLKRFK